MKLMTKSALLTLSIALSGCVTGPVIAPAGSFNAEPFSLTLANDWSSFARKGEGVKGAALTKDGRVLNELAVYLIEDERDLKLGKGGAQEEVVYNPGLSQLELVEFATATLTSLSYKNVETVDVKLVIFVGQDGVGFDFTGFYESGLKANGIMRLAETENGLAVGFYVSPERVYFDRDAAEARVALDSARLP